MTRINIQYSIELDELATEVSRLYKRAGALLNNISLIQYADSQILTSSLVNHIHETRLQLAQADAMLGDIQSMVGSYVEYEMSQTSDPMPAEERIPPVRAPSTLSDIDATLQQIKETVENEKPPQRPA